MTVALAEFHKSSRCGRSNTTRAQLYCFTQSSFLSIRYHPMATRTKKDHLIRFRCECGKKLKAEPDIIGKKVQCTQCPRIHRVPATDRLGPKKVEPSSTPELEDGPNAIANTPASAVSNTTAPEKETSSKPFAKNESQTSAAREQPSLIIKDELAAKEPSLLPSDDSDSRFKLDPKFDPEPTENLSAIENSFEFDPDDVQLTQKNGHRRNNRLVNEFTIARSAKRRSSRAPLLC